MSKSNRDFPPVSPGEILEEDFLKPMGLSQYRLPPMPCPEMVVRGLIMAA